MGCVRGVQILSDPVFYLLVYAWGRYKKQEKPKKQFFMVPLVHDIIQVQALVWVSCRGSEWRFFDCKNGGRRHLRFLKIQNFMGRKGQESNCVTTPNIVVIS